MGCCFDTSFKDWRGNAFRPVYSARARVLVAGRAKIGVPNHETHPHPSHPLLLAPLTALHAADEPKPRPNIIVILSDDLGWADLSCYGSTFHESPNLDKLAAQGMRFTQAYSSSPYCSPSRAAIMTGRHPARLKITDYIPSNTKTGKFLPAQMKMAASASNIVILVVQETENYEAPTSMRRFSEQDLQPLGHQVTLIEGDKPRKHHFEGVIEALKSAELLILFSRRRFPPHAQMAAIREYLDAGNPLVGIRTANHAFSPRSTEVVEDGLLPWPEFTQEVLGCQNAGYETKGLPYTVSIAPGSEGSALLKDVNPAKILGGQSLYKVLPLSPRALPLLVGTAKTNNTPCQPVAWTHTYGANKAHIFYTSLGTPEDMLLPDVRRLLLNAVNWTQSR